MIEGQHANPVLCRRGNKSCIIVYACAYVSVPPHTYSDLSALQDSHLQADILHPCREHGVWLAWLDAKVPVKQFERHYGSQRSRNDICSLLSMFDLILPETDVVSHCFDNHAHVQSDACCCVFMCLYGVDVSSVVHACLYCQH